MDYNIKDVVKLKSFFGKTVPDEDVDDRENYWKLIGQCGQIIEIKLHPHPAYLKKGVQVLVHFKVNLNSLGLIAHNSQKNSLWIFQDDLSLAPTLRDCAKTPNLNPKCN